MLTTLTTLLPFKYFNNMKTTDNTPIIPSSEIQIQAEAWQWLWNAYPSTRRCCFHVPNGGSRNKIEGMQLKASGVVPGVPDLILIWKGKVYGFEFKTLTGTISHAQMQVHQAWKEQGIEVRVIRTVEEFKYAIEPILKSAA